MEFKIDRRSVLKAGAALAASQALPALAQDKPTIRFAAVFSDKDIRADMIQHDHQGHRSRLHARAALRRHAVQAGHRAGRAPARQPRDRQRRPAGHQQADGRVVGPDVGLHVPRRQPRARVLRERPRRADEEGGRGPAEDQDPRADVLRHAPGGPEAEEEDHHAGGPGRHQAADAAGRRVAASRPLDRRQPDAARVRRDVHRAADRRDRRPGQPAAQRERDEVLRGDVADRADLAPDRLRRAVP